MKTTFKSVAIVAAMTALALSMGACKKDDPKVNNEGSRDVVLSFSTKAMSKVTPRAVRATQAEEDAVARVAIFGIDAEGKVAQTFEPTANPGAQLTLKVQEGVKTLRVIANPKAEHSLSYATETEIHAERVSRSEAPSFPLVMGATVSVAEGSSLSVDLIRAVAKLTVTSADPAVAVTSVAVAQTPKYTHIFAQQSIPAYTMADYTSYSEVQGNVVYVGENHAQHGTILRVKGTYKGNPFDAELTLKSEGAVIAIERNTSYTVTVKPISESEFETDVVVDSWDNGAVVDDGVFTPRGTYYSVDFHNHTGFSDGTNHLLYVLNKAQDYGIDIIVNSEHGGRFAGNAADDEEAADQFVEGPVRTWAECNLAGVILGDGAESGNMWRWQSIRDYSFPKIQEFNQGSTSLAIQGFEWNAPGHEHCSMAVITGQFDGGNNANAVAQFEYMFDANDADVTGGAMQGWTKSALGNDHEKSKEAAAWLQKHYPHTSYLVPAHPERANAWQIEHYRDMNNIAPDVFVGFESIPGHQASGDRGGYRNNSFNYGNGATFTHGGAGLQSAKIGGLWDAMLSEGRRFWLVANSDFHRDVANGTGDFYPGEYHKTYISMKDRSAQGFVDGLRAGNLYAVNGDLIDKLEFSVNTATMGETLITGSDNVTVKIVVRDPNTTNNNTYSGLTNPALNHIDLIAGDMRPKVSPGTAEYSKKTYDAVKVVARFSANGSTPAMEGVTNTAWTDRGDGFYEMTFSYPLTKDTYFRLRGTNQSEFGGAELDALGNPTQDPSMSIPEQAATAFEDLWFYSNPVFVNKM
ncbi:MAG: hypothetical protein LBU92_06510 [Prevotellaceae bacterium]|jgi:hypothetical protein|nr:hypothetical protein [Prevotellaceae bacterium]